MKLYGDSYKAGSFKLLFSGFLSRAGYDFLDLQSTGEVRVTSSSRTAKPLGGLLQSYRPL